jgi:hypothetical protein
MPRSPWADTESGITVADLVARLQRVRDQSQYVCFGPHGNFTFSELNDLGGCLQIVFNESEGADYRLDDRHPYKQWKDKNLSDDLLP